MRDIGFFCPLYPGSWNAVVLSLISSMLYTVLDYFVLYLVVLYLGSCSTAVLPRYVAHLLKTA